MEMTAVEFLQAKFRETGYTTVTDWMKATHVGMSLQTCTTVLLRGTPKGFVAMLSLAAALGCTTEEMQWIAKECGDRYLWRFITPQIITDDQRRLLDDYSSLELAQRSVIDSMIAQMKR